MADIPQELKDRFRELFTGLQRAYGRYQLDETLIATDGEKHKGKAITRREDIVPEYYDDHIDGKEMLGVVPITEENKVNFAAIDIDVYSGFDLMEFFERVKSFHYPVCATRSKSGGVHLWLFFSSPVPAKAAKEKLEAIADSLGFPGVEVFPKQNKLGPDDVGNWINLPFFACGEPEQHVRYGWDEDGNEIRDLSDWLDYAEKHRLTLRQLNQIEVNLQAVEHVLFVDGPPCLQTMAERGVPEGTRNNTMMAIAVYAKAKFEGDNAKEMGFMYDMNSQVFEEPLPDREIEQVKQSADRNDYRYQCTAAPLKDFCNRGQCLRRPYGVALNGNRFDFGTLWHYYPETEKGEAMYDEGRWRLQVNSGDDEVILDLTTEELLQPRAVESKAFVRHIVMPRFDNAEWRVMIQDKMMNHREDVIYPEESSSIGALRILIGTFLALNSNQQGDKKEVMRNRVYLDEETQRYWFLWPPFLKHLDNYKFNDYRGALLMNVVRQHFDFQNEQRRLDKHAPSSTRFWSCPASLVNNKPDLDMHVVSDF